MKLSRRILGASFVLGVLSAGLGGCGTVDDGDGGYVPAYGDYGYVGPWPYNYVEWGGGGYARPPFHPDEHHEPIAHGGAPIDRGRPAPARGGGIPSIPNAPRGGGGGGGHPGGGGGAPRGGGGGGGGDHKR